MDTLTRSVPFQLRANDVVRHIINVDSRFRDAPTVSTATNFNFSLLSPVRNVLRIRVTSVEFPNNYYFFTHRRRNTWFRVVPAVGPAFDVEVPDGNYTAGDMVDAIAADLSGQGIGWLSVAFSETEGAFTFTSTGATPFTIDTATRSWNRPFDYGLGFYLGFSRGSHPAASDGPGVFSVTSDRCANFAGDNYLFVRVNDYDCVRQTVRVYAATGVADLQTNEFPALAKIVLREPKNFMAFDDYASQHAKEVVFPAPSDIARLQIQVLDPYGEIMDLCGAQWSMSLEVLEVRNLSLYNSLRDSLSVRYTV
jgi:hypothetical protein